MPSFLRDLNLRRKSKASFKAAVVDADTTSISNSGNTSSNDASNDNAGEPPPLNKSSSTLSDWYDRHSPPATIASLRSRSHTQLPSGNGTRTPPALYEGSNASRPRLASAQGKQRYSLAVRSILSRCDSLAHADLCADHVGARRRDHLAIRPRAHLDLGSESPLRHRRLMGMLRLIAIAPPLPTHT